jgi:hypothetical protein
MKKKAIESYELNRVTVDWVSMGTWDRGQYEGVRCFFERSGLTQEGRIRQYKTMGDGGGNFVGEGEQGGLAHYICQFTGYDAHKALVALGGVSWYKPQLWKASRLDIQLTLEVNDYRLVGADWVRRSPHRVRGVKHEESGDGDTVYLGSRKGSKFARIYVKNWIKDDEGEKGQHIRVEFQLRHDIANRYWAAQRWGDSWIELWQGLKGDRERVKGYSSSLCPTVTDVFDNWIDSPSNPIPCQKSVGADTKKWLAHTVTSAIKKLSNSHDRDDREFIRAMLGVWGEISERGERGMVDYWGGDGL